MFIPLVLKFGGGGGGRGSSGSGVGISLIGFLFSYGDSLFQMRCFDYGFSFIPVVVVGSDGFVRS